MKSNLDVIAQKDLEMACVYYHLYLACEIAELGFDNYANVWYLYDNNKDAQPQANSHIVEAYTGTEIFLEYGLQLDMNLDFNDVVKFIKAGKGRGQASCAAYYFNEQLAYLKPIVAEYEKSGLWQEAENFWNNEHTKFLKITSPYSQNDHELLPLLKQRVNKILKY